MLVNVPRKVWLRGRPERVKRLFARVAGPGGPNWPQGRSEMGSEAESQRVLVPLLSFGVMVGAMSGNGLGQ